MFGAADGKMKVLIMAYGADSMCVCVSAQFFFIQWKHIMRLCDCICISHKVSSNWETAALMLTVGLHAKITHAYAHTPTKTQSVSPQRLSPPLLVRTLIRGEHHKSERQRESVWERFVKDEYSVWHQSFAFDCSTLAQTPLAKLSPESGRGQ